jgi:hypothetical protein
MKLSYCAQQLYEIDRDRFFQSLFVPEAQRHFLHVLGALNCELIRIHSNVTEEMIGHIRYAWWQEKIEALYEGQSIPGHPVLEALQPMVTQSQLPKAPVLALIETYRAHYPEAPHDMDIRVDTLSEILINTHCPQALARWKKAGDIIVHHRLRYKMGYHGLLAIKLLLFK